jgi:hypothetical protein
LLPLTALELPWHARHPAAQFGRNTTRRRLTREETARRTLDIHAEAPGGRARTQKHKELAAA